MTDRPPPKSPERDDFHAAVARIFPPSSAPRQVDRKTPAEALAQSLTLDVPKIDSAVRAYLSLVAARSAAASGTDRHCSSSDGVGSLVPGGSAVEKCIFSKEGGRDPNMDSLRCARALLKAINGTTLPDPEEASASASVSVAAPKSGEEKSRDCEDGLDPWLEGQVVRLVWNGLISKGHKPSKVLGRRAMIHAYPVVLERVRMDGADEILPPGVGVEKSKVFFEEFGALLRPRDAVAAAAASTAVGFSDDDDSALLWDADGGEAELKKRRDRRAKRGKAAAASAAAKSREDIIRTLGAGLEMNGDASRPAEPSFTIEEIIEEEQNSDK